MIVEDARRDPRFTPLIDQGDYPLHALLTVPLQSRAGVIGALQFVDEQVGRFTEANLKLAESLAATAVPATSADAHQLQQLFINLINNALQAMDGAEKGSQLTITTKFSLTRMLEPSREETVLIIVQDDGPGIMQEHIPRVFDPFFTTKAEGQGTGLGLAVCHSIVADHQGNIWIESTPGRGAAFFIELPVIAPEPEVEDEEAKATAVISSGKELVGRRIWVVDDEVSVLMIMTRILRRKEFVADGVEGGEAALKRLQTESYDLIVSDLRMSGMSGQEFYRRTLEKYPKYNGRFIFTTGDVINPKLRTFLEANNVTALEKPFDIDDLIHIAVRHLTRT